MRTKFRWVSVAVAVAAVAMSSCVKAGNSAGSGMVWVATQGDQKLTSFSVNLTTGAVSHVGSAVDTGLTPIAMTITPDGKTIFLVDKGDGIHPGDVAIYSVNSDGSLKSVSCSGCTVGVNPVAATVDPTGKFLFVANQGTVSDNTSGTITVFGISSGSLSPVGAFPTETVSDTTGTGPSSVAVSPVSYSCTASVGGAAETCYAIYVANEFTNTITAYEYYLDSSNNFTLNKTIGNSPYATGTNPASLAFSRCAGVSTATTICATADGNNLFVANAGSNTVSMFTACIQVSTACATADGSLLPAGGPVAAGVGPVSVIVDPTLNFVYAVNAKSNEVSQFKYNPSTATLSALSPASVSTAANPMAGTITAGGNVIFVSNNGSSSMSVFTVTTTSTNGGAPSGRLVPPANGSVQLTAQPLAILAR